MKKVDFQVRAQDEVVARGIQLLNRSARSTITFKAPTGSGKTVMMAQALAGLSKECQGKHNLAIIWLAPNRLHKQSHGRLLSVYGTTKALACLLPEELSGPDLPDQSVLFLNWDSINSENLVLRRDSETRRNLDSFIGRARAVGKKVVLVVDESHMHLNSGEGAQVVVDHIIQPDLLIEVSATPRNARPDWTVTVLREDVIDAGFIRKRVVVNPGEITSFDGTTLNTTYSGTSENLLDIALEKQRELTRRFRQEGSPVTPLILVQLPNRRSSADALERFENYLLRRHGLARGNGVAVWLSDDKTSENNDIAAFTSTVQVLFFKQGIGTGWDCPRAQILVGLREMKSETFTAQVLGRIIRQPEHKHYADEFLNYSYAFTNYEKLELDAETASWMGKVLVQAQGAFEMPLPSWAERRADRRGHLTYAAVDAILAHRAILTETQHRGPVFVRMLNGAVIEDLDSARTIEGTHDVPIKLAGLQERMNTLKADLVRALAAQGSGQKYVEKALRDAAALAIGTDEEQVVLETILHRDNRELFLKMAEAGMKDFLEGQAKAERQFESSPAWSAPATRFLDLSEPITGYDKCLYRPVLSGQFQKSNVEEPFSRMLDSNLDVDRWLKNGDVGREHFAIKYMLDGEEALFYPDFLVRTSSGGFRIYDTKGSGSSELSTGNMADTHAKARALHEFIAEHRANGVDVDGGIVVRKDGQWWLHPGESYPGTVEISEAKGWLPFSIM